MPNRQWYVLVACFLSSIVTGVVAIVLAVTLAARSIERDHEQQAKAREQGRAVVCSVVNTQLAIYRSAPPTTPTGEEAIKAWTAMGQLYSCI